MWVLLHWLRAVMLSGELEGGYVGAPTHTSFQKLCHLWNNVEEKL